MLMVVIPDLPPSNPDIPSTFIMVLGQCDHALLRSPPVFEVVENPSGSANWETEGGYPLSTYMLEVE